MTVYCLVSLLYFGKISTESRLLHSNYIHFLCPEPEAPGVRAKKEDFPKTESPTELVGQSLNHKQLEVLRIATEELPCKLQRRPSEAEAPVKGREELTAPATSETQYLSSSSIGSQQHLGLPA